MLDGEGGPSEGGGDACKGDVDENSLVDRECGIWHLANEGAISWAALALAIAQRWRRDASLVEPTPAAALGYRAPRPHYSVLRSRRALLLPTLDDALDRYTVERVA